jgi:hypothetical protein
MKKNPPAAAAALTCGILALCLSLLPFAGMVLAMAALVLSQRAKRAVVAAPDAYAATGMPTAANICALIALAFSSLALLFWFALGALVAAAPHAAAAAADPPVTF